MQTIDCDWLPQKRRPTHPGEILREVLQERRITQQDFADALDIPRVRLNALLNGRRAVTPDTAMRLGRVLGTSAGLWLGMQHARDLWDALHGPHAAKIAKLRPLGAA